MTEVETFFISFSFYGFYVILASAVVVVCLHFQTLQHPYFSHCRNLSSLITSEKYEPSCSDFFCVFCLAMVLILVEIHFLSCSIIHKIWWETFMKLIFIKIVCFRNKNKERKKGKFFRKRKQLKENRILRLFLSANSMGNKNI